LPINWLFFSGIFSLTMLIKQYAVCLYDRPGRLIAEGTCGAPHLLEDVEDP